MAPTIVIVSPSRSAHPSARSANGWRHSATATATLVSVCTTMARPMIAEQDGVERRADVEVARRAAPGLQVDDHHFEDEHDGGRPADDAACALASRAGR